MDVQLLAIAGEEGNRPSPLVATDGDYVTWAVARSKAVEVACLNQLSAEPLRLSCESQEGPVTALTLGQASIGSSDPQPLTHGKKRPTESVLVVATRSSVVLWRLQPLFAASAAHSPPLQLASGLGPVDALVLCSETNRLAVCAGYVVHVFELLHLTHAFRLEGHRGIVLAAAFCWPHQPGWLLTTGEDRTYRLWDVHEGTLMYESPVLTASALMCVAIDPSAFRCALGAADGLVRFFDLDTHPVCRCLKVSDVAKQLSRAAQAAQTHAATLAASGAAQIGPRIVGPASTGTAAAVRLGSGIRGMAGAGSGAGRAGWGVDGDAGGLQAEPSTPAIACGDGIVGLSYCQLRTGLPEGPSGLLGESPRLLVGCMRGLCVLDTHSYELLQVHFYAGAGVSLGPLNSGLVVSQDQVGLLALPEVEVPRAYASALASHGQYMYCCCTSSTSSEVYVLSARPRPLPGTERMLEAHHAHLYMPGLSDGHAPSAGSAPSPAKQDGPQAAGAGPPNTPLLSVFMTSAPPANSPLMAGQSLPRSSSSGSAGSGSAAVGPGRRTSAPAAAPAPGERAAEAGGSKASCWAKPEGRKPEPARRPSSGAVKLPPLGALKRSSSTNSPNGKPGGKPTALQDKPVVFHRQIKSSGYGFVQPQVKMGRPPPAPVKLDPRPTPVNQVARQLLAARQYPLDSRPPVTLQEDQRLAQPRARLHRGALLGLKYSGDGSRLLTCSADKTARVLKLPLAKYQGEGTDLLGHNGAVTCADWSQDSTMVLTGSTDRTARLWLSGCAQPALEIAHTRQQAHNAPGAAAALQPSLTRSPSAPSRSTTPPFLNEVNAARFFYLDRFVLLATGNKLHMFTFQLCDGDPKDDLSRLRNNNTYSLVTTWTGASQAINTFAAVNTFQSPLVLLAASNRSIEVLNCTSMQRVATIPDAHARPVHTIVQSAGASMFTSHPREANELFATAATDGLLKLWDVRVCRCVRTFSAHKNSQITVGAAFSPCLRYLACGSEDQALHVYDVRQGSLMHRLREPHGDAVTVVAFNPLVPQMAAGNLVGGVHFYGT